MFYKDRGGEIKNIEVYGLISLSLMLKIAFLYKLCIDRVYIYKHASTLSNMKQKVGGKG